MFRSWAGASACLQIGPQSANRGPPLRLRLLRILFQEVGFASMDSLSAITPQLAVLGLGTLVLLVVTFVLVNIALRE
jgi:hypothetical protein